MSKNISEHKIERQVVTHLNTLSTQASQARSIQKQGTQAIRLGVVEGYFAIDLPFPTTENARFIEFEAPDSENIMIGSVVSSRYIGTYNPAGGSTVDFVTPDVSNTLFNGEDITTWMPYSLATDDPNYSTPFYLADIPDVRLPDNRVRVGCKVNFRLGAWSTDTTMVVVMYQLRFTIGWN